MISVNRLNKKKNNHHFLFRRKKKTTASAVVRFTLLFFFFSKTHLQHIAAAFFSSHSNRDVCFYRCMAPAM